MVFVTAELDQSVSETAPLFDLQEELFRGCEVLMHNAASSSPPPPPPLMTPQ